MKNKLLLSLAGFALATVFSPASAQFYVGAGLGAGSSSGINGSGPSALGPLTVTGDGTKTSYKLLGGYQFTPNWGLEAQYTNIGKFSDTVSFGAPTNATGTFSSTTASQWSLAGTGTLPIGSGFSLIGKLGASRNKFGATTLTLGAIPLSLPGSSKTDLLIGAGIGYDLTKNVGMRLEYENFGKFCSNCGGGGGAVKGDNWALSVKYSF